MSGPDDDPDQGFLTRWSRRKRLVAEDDLHAKALVQEQVPGGTAPAEPDARPRDPETGELIDEELVRSLPSPADLQPGGDLSAFIDRKSVV